MDHEETGCQAHPEGPILCVNNCGFFGSAATMNMCSKCHKDMMLKQEQEKLAVSSIGSFVNGTSSSNGIGPVVAAATVDVKACPEEPKATSSQPASSQPGFTFGPEATKTTVSQSPFKFGSDFVSETHTGGPLFTFGSGSSGEPKPDGPKRCTTCNKRVGLTGFSCRCGDLFCAVHRYSDKHGCPFDYRTAGRDAIAKANPLVKAKKLDKI